MRRTLTRFNGINAMFGASTVDAWEAAALTYAASIMPNYAGMYASLAGIC